ncbi:MAG: type ISP restriction/modification enzyme, partial [Thermoguttaceae bacterium]
GGTMTSLILKPSHKLVKAYYDALAQFEKLGVKHEGAVRSAFQTLLEHCARQAGRTLVPEYQLKGKTGRPIESDGAIVDALSQVLRYGLWEAEDTDDDLGREIKAKFTAGYPRDNILFQEPRRAILYQNGEKLIDADLTKPDQLVHVLDLFFAWRPPAFDEWEKAVEEFKSRVQKLGENLARFIRNERQTNAAYRDAYAEFLSLCRGSLNPNLSESAVEEMIIQHLLTERIFRKVFDIGDFMQRNVIAQRIEKVIEALRTSGTIGGGPSQFSFDENGTVPFASAFSRDAFAKNLEHFYIAIEQAAETISDFSEKQRFLNTVYERFFQGFCVKVADTHGIVYTPQPLAGFMAGSVEHVLQTMFETSLADQDVHILDPFTGTGNFVVNLMRLIPKSALRRKYREELHCNELMLLPYYVASMNIEHAFWEATGDYEAFEGICLVDTFETAEKVQRTFDIFNEANTEGVQRQRKAPIKVIIANPPYNAGQVQENDNNKNRKYEEIDRRVRVTYSADSKAKLVRKLSDPYVKAIRFASDRIGDAGIVCYVNNDSFVAEKSFDGMRKHLTQDFDLIYILELGGNVRKNPTLSGTTHNVFGIQVGVSINLFIRLPKKDGKKRLAKIRYHAVPVHWRREQKYDFLKQAGSIANVKWRVLHPDEKNNWLTNKNDGEFAEFIPLGDRKYKARSNLGLPTIFRKYSLGVSTNRDSVVYGFDAERLAKRVERFVDDYNAELDRWHGKASPPDDPQKSSEYVDAFVSYERVKWSRDLKLRFARGIPLKFSRMAIIESLYRPFTKQLLYNQKGAVDRTGRTDEWFPNDKSREENLLLCVNMTVERPFTCIATNLMPNLVATAGFGSATYCFPLYTYEEDGKRRVENIPLFTLQHFQKHYEDKAITREDVFHYVYGLLHHPDYRASYSENLKRELARVPLSGTAVDFRAFAAAGRKLADLHVNYEGQKAFPLKHVENPEARLDWRVEAMKLSKDRDAVQYNEFLSLAGIPQEAFDYRLGNRSALEWVIDQYRVTRDEHGDISSDPNRDDDEQYIVRLVGQVITVSLETRKIVAGLPPLAT